MDGGARIVIETHQTSVLRAPQLSRVRQIWAIGGGKGGVGKSLVASSISIALSRMGLKVTAVDLDLGGANLHTSLGADLPRQTLSDFFSGRVDKLTSCLVPSGIPQLELISGAQDAIGVADIDGPQKMRLMTELRQLESDFVILDLGAGTSYNTLDFFIHSDVGIVTILPEPTSIENAYRFIKSLFYRRLALSPRLQAVRGLIDMAMDSKNPKGIRTPSDLFKEISRHDPESATRMKEEIARFQPKLILNQARTQTDIDIGFSVKSVTKKYFGIDMDYIGYLDYDSAVWQAVRRKRPLMLEFPNSKLVSSIERITESLVNKST